jgi:hypothetical protein
MVGAVAGSPGTLPTNYSVSASGLTRTVVGIGTENGLQYVDLRFNGTSTTTFFEVFPETTTQIAAANGQTWTSSFYIKTTSMPTPPNSYALNIIERTSAGVYVANGTQSITIDSTLKRYNQTRTLSGGATVGVVLSSIVFNLTNGATYDFTIRIAAPQMELGAYATTFIPTTTAAVTRLADTASKTGVSSLIGQQEGVVYWEGILPQASTAGAAQEVNMFNTERQPNTRTSLVIAHRASTNSLSAYLFIGNGTFTPIISLGIGGFASGSFAKIAFAYKSGSSALYINGVQRATSSVTYNSVTTIDQMNFNDNVVVYGYTSQQFVNQAALFPTRLTNDQLEVLTSEGYGTYALLAQSLNCVLQ